MWPLLAVEIFNFALVFALLVRRRERLVVRLLGFLAQQHLVVVVGNKLDHFTSLGPMPLSVLSAFVVSATTRTS